MTRERDERRQARWQKRWETGEPSPHGYLIVNGDREILGFGETVDEALQDARTWESEEHDQCPFCGRVPTEHSWRAYLLDSDALELYWGWGDGTLLIDGWLAWAGELDPPRYVDVKDAWCIVCRNDAEDEKRERCPACEEGRIEHDGVPPDLELPPATFAAWTAS